MNLKVGIISLGCPKNLTDTEVILGTLSAAGYEITSNERDADILIINTCAFIKPAIDEALSEIRHAVKLKAKGIVKYVIVAGCLPQRTKSKIPNGVDAVVGAGSIDKIVEVLNGLQNPSRLPSLVSHLPSQRSCLFDWKTPRIKATPRHYAYIKIADGCDNRCTYCTVPNIRGPYRSRPINDIVKEAKALAASGTKELILVAQDTTYYGKDLYGKYALSTLLKRLAGIRGIRWIRLMYAHPGHLTDEVIKVIANEDKIVKYLDLPLQHFCDRILALMGRRVAARKIVGLMEKIRRRIPGIAIRTTFIVGFPGESEKDFNRLLGFIEKEKFERLGIFTYRAESGTPAIKLRGSVPERIKRSRYHQAMRLQNHISGEINKSKLGKVVSVILDRATKKGFIGRTEADAPDIDGSVIVSAPSGVNKDLKVGEIVPVRIRKVSSYDLFGSLVT